MRNGTLRKKNIHLTFCIEMHFDKQTIQSQPLFSSQKIIYIFMKVIKAWQAVKKSQISARQSNRKSVALFIL